MWNRPVPGPFHCAAKAAHGNRASVSVKDMIFGGGVKGADSRDPSYKGSIQEWIPVKNILCLFDLVTILNNVFQDA